MDSTIRVVHYSGMFLIVMCYATSFSKLSYTHLHPCKLTYSVILSKYNVNPPATEVVSTSTLVRYLFTLLGSNFNFDINYELLVV